jgi:hypothetical protein
MNWLRVSFEVYSINPTKDPLKIKIFHQGNPLPSFQGFNKNKKRKMGLFYLRFFRATAATAIATITITAAIAMYVAVGSLVAGGVTAGLGEGTAV